MDGLQFEHRCAELLRYRGFHKVAVTKGSGDQGVDILAQKNGIKYGIQCKYYSYPVGNKAIQEAYAGADFYDCDVAMVMTNSTFTRQARELADKTWRRALGTLLSKRKFICDIQTHAYI